LGTSRAAYTVDCGPQLGDIDDMDTGAPDDATDSSSDLSEDDTFDESCWTCDFDNGEECAPGGFLGTFVRFTNNSPEPVKLNIIITYKNDQGEVVDEFVGRSKMVDPGKTVHLRIPTGMPEGATKKELAKGAVNANGENYKTTGDGKMTLKVIKDAGNEDYYAETVVTSTADKVPK
jgi:hypothetical protein